MLPVEDFGQFAVDMFAASVKRDSTDQEREGLICIAQMIASVSANQAYTQAAKAVDGQIGAAVTQAKRAILWQIDPASAEEMSELS